MHDTDSRYCQKDGREVTNPARTLNERILETKNDNVRLVASRETFEVAYFGEITKKDKPYYAINKIKEDQNVYSNLKQLLDYLIGNE